MVAILFAHFLGDFLFQTNDMALNKSTSIKWLSLHVLAYTFSLFAVAVFILGTKGLLLFLFWNALLHWIVDFFTSKVIARLSSLSNKKWFYTMIGFDQFLHAATLIVTYDIFSKS